MIWTPRPGSRESDPSLASFTLCGNFAQTSGHKGAWHGQGGRYQRSRRAPSQAPAAAVIAIAVPYQVT